MPFPRLAAVLFFFSLAATGCLRKEGGAPASFENEHERLERLYAKPDRNSYKTAAELALLDFYAGQNEVAARRFDEAQRVAEELYTRSAGELLASKLFNESVKSYRGPALERWTLMLLAGMNRLQRRDREGALVELRRLSRELRLDADPYGEKRHERARELYLALTGFLFAALGSEEEGFADSLMAYKMDAAVYPEKLKPGFLSWAQRRGLLDKEKGADAAREFVAGARGVALSFHLSGEAPHKEEQRISVTMFDYWPIVHGMAGEQSSDAKQVEHVQSVFLGAVGRRLITVAYAIYVRPGGSAATAPTTGLALPCGDLLMESWEQQKSRLIAQHLVRIALKLAGSLAAADAIENHVQGIGGQLLGNLAALAIWELERADLRHVRFLPNAIGLEWSWKDPGVLEAKIESKGVLPFEVPRQSIPAN